MVVHGTYIFNLEFVITLPACCTSVGGCTLN